MPAMQKATRQQTKGHNTRLVFKTIYDLGQTSRADLARRTHLTRPTVSTIVADLLAADFVVETGQGPSAGGKPPTLLSVNRRSRQTLSLDLSGDSFRGALTTLLGEIDHQVSLPAGGATGDKALELVYELIGRLQSASTAPLLGIGVGTPGLVDPFNGVVRRAVNLGWIDLPLRDLLKDRFGLPVHVANDSHMAALAEHTFGEVESGDNLIVVRIGQGIGAGIVLHGRPFYGDGYGAGEIGHVVVDAGGAPCSCGNAGCLETTSSTRAILSRARKELRSDATTVQTAELTWEDFARAVESGHPLAVEIAESAGHYLGIAAANLVACFNVHHIVFAGRVADLGDYILAPARREMRRRVLPAMADDTTLSFSALGRSSVLLGSSALVLQRELGIV